MAGSFLRSRGLHNRWVPILLCLPLVPLGIYSIYPHPFYDPDCTLAILLGLALLWLARTHLYPKLLCVAAGISFLLPFFFKQNVGLAFVGILYGTLVTSWKRLSSLERRALSWMALGTFTAALIGFVVIQVTAGMENYIYWTVIYPSSVRLRPRYLSELVTAKVILVTCFGLLGILLIRLRRRWHLVGWLLIVVPFLWMVAGTETNLDLSTPSSLIAAWPVVILWASVLVVVGIFRRRPPMELCRVVVLVGVSLSAFLSQGVRGSSYGIWPIFVLLTAFLVSEVAEITTHQVAVSMAFVLALTMAILGWQYLERQDRLRLFVSIPEGQVSKSEVATLAGLSLGGDFVADLDDVLRFVSENVAVQEGIVALPGEDPIYFALQRKPVFPVLNFEETTNPYDAQELVELRDSVGIAWILVKRDRQLLYYNFDESTLALLTGFELVQSVGGYDVYRRR